MAEKKPEDPKALPDNWKERFAKLVNKRVPNAGVCIRCGSASKLAVGDHLVSPPTWNKDGGLVIGGPSYPQAMLICSNCGHTSYFNLVALGIVGGDGDG